MKSLLPNASWIFPYSDSTDKFPQWKMYFRQIILSSTKHLPESIFGLCIINLLGALLKIRLKEKHFHLPIILFLMGCMFEILSFSSLKVEKFTESIQWMDPVIFINLFTPVIIFSVSFETDFCVFQRLFWQIFILTVLGFFLNYILVDWYLTSVNKLVLENGSRVIFAIILVCTDPMQTTGAMKSVGLSKGLRDLINGECMLMAALADITFKITLQIVNSHNELSTTLSVDIFNEIMKKFLGSAVFGFVHYKILHFGSNDILSDGITEGMLGFSLIYINFYVAEWSGMSGIVSLYVSALFLNSTVFKPGVNYIIFKFWKIFRYFASLMTFTLAGMLVPAHAYLYVSFSDIYYTVHLYFTLIVIRILVFLILSPILSRLGYGFPWSWAFTIVWTEMRGLLNINMALLFSYSENSPGSEREKSQILLHGVTICFITLLINSITLPQVVIHLNLHKITLTQRKLLYYTVQHFQEIIKTEASALKFDKDLANADWNLVDKKITFQNPYELQPQKSDQKLKCPNCNKEIKEIQETQISTEIMELARVRLLSAQIASYERQYTNEILSQNAVNVLVGAAGNFGDKKGEFMSFQTINAYVGKKNIFNLFKKTFQNLASSTEKEKGVPPKNPVLLLCHKIVFSDEFEYTGHLVIMLSMAPLIISWIPRLHRVYSTEIRNIHHAFIFFYVMEAIFKMIAMGKRFLQQNWNICELAITLIAIIEEILLEAQYIGTTDQLSQSMIFLRVVKLLRIFHILKLITPKLLQLMTKRANHQLSCAYSVIKGYVQGEADIACVIDQISSCESVAQVLRDCVSKNAENAMKELGYLEYDHPDMAISVKTKEEINTLLNMASKIVESFKSKGMINEAEVSEIHKIIIAKRKDVADFEPVIRLPSLDEMLYHIPWLNKSEVHINFIKKKVQVLTFDCGNHIFEEGDDVKGIYLIISGMIKRMSSRPYLGLDQMISERKKKTHADYIISGAIIGELNCLTNEPMKFTATCKTVVETYFIPKYHLYETFKECCPSIEYKIWLKLALGIGVQKVKEILAYEDWVPSLLLQLCYVYVRDVPMNDKVDIYDETMNYVILVYGSAKDCQLKKMYFAPQLIPKTCYQIQGTGKITKILVIQTSIDLKKCRSNTERYVPVCKHGVEAGYVKLSKDSSYEGRLTSDTSMDFRKHKRNCPSDIRLNEETSEQF